MHLEEMFTQNLDEKRKRKYKREKINLQCLSILLLTLRSFAGQKGAFQGSRWKAASFDGGKR